MRRSTFAMTVAFGLAFCAAVGALAASPPSGTIECSVVPTRPELGLTFAPPYLSSQPAPRGIGMKTKMKGQNCNNGGVSGGKAPITHVAAKLVGRFADGTTCATLTSAPAVESLSVKIKWQGLNNGGRLKTIATSSARVGSVSWDGMAHALTFVTGPLKGGFAGSTSTVTLTLEGDELLTANCPTYAGLFYGGDGESSITVP